MKSETKPITQEEAQALAAAGAPSVTITSDSISGISTKSVSSDNADDSRVWAKSEDGSLTELKVINIGSLDDMASDQKQNGKPAVRSSDFNSNLQGLKTKLIGFVGNLKAQNDELEALIDETDAVVDAAKKHQNVHQIPSNAAPKITIFGKVKSSWDKTSTLAKVIGSATLLVGVLALATGKKVVKYTKSKLFPIDKENDNVIITQDNL